LGDGGRGKKLSIWADFSIKLKHIYRFSPYHAVNILYLRYKNQSVNAV